MKLLKNKGLRAEEKNIEINSLNELLNKLNEIKTNLNTSDRLKKGYIDIESVIKLYNFCENLYHQNNELRKNQGNNISNFNINKELENLKIAKAQLKNEKDEFKKEIEKQAIFSKADGKKKQKKGLDKPDYELKSFKEIQTGFEYEFLTPFTYDTFKLNLDELKKVILNDLKQITNDDNIKIKQVKMVNNLFYLIIESKTLYRL